MTFTLKATFATQHTHLTGGQHPQDLILDLLQLTLVFRTLCGQCEMTFKNNNGLDKMAEGCR